MEENEAFVKKHYPSAYAQKNGKLWDVNINSMEGLVDNAPSKREAWSRAANLIRNDDLKQKV